jgi:hypothetical protein
VFSVWRVQVHDSSSGRHLIVFWLKVTSKVNLSTSHTHTHKYTRAGDRKTTTTEVYIYHSVATRNGRAVSAYGRTISQALLSSSRLRFPNYNHHHQNATIVTITRPSYHWRIFCVLANPIQVRLCIFPYLSPLHIPLNHEQPPFRRSYYCIKSEIHS